MNNYWFVPIISIILLIFAGVGGQSIYNNEISSNAKAINITNVSSNIGLVYGYYTGDITCFLTVAKGFDHLDGRVDFYDSKGAKMNAASHVIPEGKVGANMTFNIRASYISKEKPSKAILTVYDEPGSLDPIYTLEIKL